MRRGRSTYAAGPASTGTTPILAHSISSRFATLTVKSAACNLKKLNFAEFAKFPLRIAKPKGLSFSCSSASLTALRGISNRHRMQLEIVATHAESGRSLFLIVPNRPHLLVRSAIRDASTRGEGAREPSGEENSRGLEVRREAAVVYVMAEAMTPKAGWGCETLLYRGDGNDNAPGCHAHVAGRQPATTGGGVGGCLAIGPDWVRCDEGWKGGVEPPHSIGRRSRASGGGDTLVTVRRATACRYFGAEVELGEAPLVAGVFIAGVSGPCAQ
jgi:hypothetical protein